MVSFQRLKAFIYKYIDLLSIHMVIKVPIFILNIMANHLESLALPVSVLCVCPVNDVTLKQHCIKKMVIGKIM